MTSLDIKELQRREIYLSELLMLSRAQRRKRGIRIDRYRIELELGAVQHAIERLTAATDAAGAAGNA